MATHDWRFFMTTVTITEARERLTELGDLARQGSRVIVEQEGKGFFALVPVEDAEYMMRLEDEHDIKAVLESEHELTKSWEQVKKELGL